MLILNLKDLTTERMPMMKQDILLELYYADEERTARSVCISDLQQSWEDTSSGVTCF